MASEVSTIQSLKAVDAWIDVINANINGGVRTAFKASRLKFGGSNTDVQRTGNGTSLPLQFPEPGLTTVNTVIDFGQGAVTASTETTHLAIQGEGFFVLVDPASVNPDGTMRPPTANTRVYITRDGEFRTNQNGILVNSSGYVLMTIGGAGVNLLHYTTALNGNASVHRAIYNDLDTSSVATVATRAIKLSSYLTNQYLPATTVLADGVSTLTAGICSPLLMPGGKQNLAFSALGSTVFDIGYQFANGALGPGISLDYSGSPTAGPSTILTKSLEASNASMTQSVPELSLAQKLFSALTKVLQTKQTNVDGVLNLVR
jgi:flagellar hook protein FlgE